MPRFNLVLDDALHLAFLRCFPEQGQRTAVLRKCVRLLIKQAQIKGSLSDHLDLAAREVTETIMK